jgi:tetratricopeptide (TPR) repeat protein
VTDLRQNGEMVKEGDVVVQFDTTQQEYNLREAEADLAEAHIALAAVRINYDWDWVGAEQEYKRAVQLSPSSTTTHLRYAELLSTLGRHDEAVAEIERAAALDPLSPLVASNVGRILYYARRYDEAIAVLTKALALDPSRVYSRIHLARCYEQKGMYADGLAEFERIKVFFNGQAGVGFAHFYAVTGHRQEAKALLRNLLQQPGDSDWFFLAGVYVALGDSDRAFASLETAYAKHDFYLPFLKVDPIMDPIRSDPRYTGLLVRLGMV